MRIIRALELIAIFSIQFIIANGHVIAWIALPNSRLRPAVVGVPLQIKSKIGIWLFGHLITLTPGSLTLDLSKDGKVLFVHLLHTHNPDKFISKLKARLEARLIQIFDSGANV